MDWETATETVRTSERYESLDHDQQRALHMLIDQARAEDLGRFREDLLPHVLNLFGNATATVVAQTCAHLAEHGSFFVSVHNEGTTLDTFTYQDQGVALPTTVKDHIQSLITNTLASEYDFEQYEPGVFCKLQGVGQIRFDEQGRLVVEYCDDVWNEFTDYHREDTDNHESLDAFVRSLDRQPDAAYRADGQYVAEYRDTSETPLPDEIIYVWNQHKHNTVYDLVAGREVPRQETTPTTGEGLYLLTLQISRGVSTHTAFCLTTPDGWREASARYQDRSLLWSYNGGVSDPLEVQRPLEHINAQPITYQEAQTLASMLGSRWGAQYFLGHFNPHPIERPPRPATTRGEGAMVLVSWYAEDAIAGIEQGCFLCLSAEDWAATQARLKARLSQGELVVEMDDHREVVYQTWGDLSAALKVEALTSAQATTIQRFFRGGRFGNLAPLFS